MMWRASNNEKMDPAEAGPSHMGEMLLHSRSATTFIPGTNIILESQIGPTIPTAVMARLGWYRVDACPISIGVRVPDGGGRVRRIVRGPGVHCGVPSVILFSILSKLRHYPATARRVPYCPSWLM